MPYEEDVAYDPVTGARLTPQYGEPTATPSLQGMTLPEQYARAKAQQLFGIATGPGRVLAGEVPTYAIDARTGAPHTSPQLMDLAGAIATLAKTSPRAITTPNAAAFNPTWWQGKVADRESNLIGPPDSRDSDAVTLGNTLSQLALLPEQRM